MSQGYKVIKSFNDRKERKTLRNVGDVYSSNDKKRISHLLDLGYIAKTEVETDGKKN